MRPSAIRTQSIEQTELSSDSLLAAMVRSRLVQLLFHIALATVPPSIYWAIISNGEFDAVQFQNTIGALTAGAAFIWFVMDKLRSYAKSRLLSYVFPVNFLIYSGALSIIAILRLDYSVYQFVIGVTGGFLASFVATIFVRRAIKAHFVVPGGRTGEVVLGGHYQRALCLEEMQSYIEAHCLHGSIVADLHYDHPPEWERLFAQAALAGVPVYHYRQIAETQSGQVKISHLSENDLGSLIPNAPYMTTKRAIDILVSLVLLPFCLVGFLFIAALIKLDSPGSAFFIQERMGHRGQVFRMIKFRTMRERNVSGDEDAMRQDAMTQSDDDRITRLGRFLRKTRIDELPQILNVLRGDMSWIGPRPEAKSLSDWYERELPFYSYRHIVRPGITGWAQVNQGHVTDVTDVNAKLRYDFYYVKHISMWIDFLIVLKTVRVILTGIGAK